MADSGAGAAGAAGARWLKQAAFDLEDAALVTGAGRYALACFLCHQAAEKAVTPTIRVADPSDVEGIVAMHERCTARSLTFRYLSGTFRPWTSFPVRSPPPSTRGR